MSSGFVFPGARVEESLYIPCIVMSAPRILFFCQRTIVSFVSVHVLDPSCNQSPSITTHLFVDFRKKYSSSRPGVSFPSHTIPITQYST